jgi:hypothetical protein
MTQDKAQPETPAQSALLGKPERDFKVNIKTRAFRHCERSVAIS